MRTQENLQTGQQLARTIWGTHESGEAFDRKKSPFLTERAQQFIVERGMCVLAGMTPDSRLDAVLLMESPGFVNVLDASTCQFSLQVQGRTANIYQGIQYGIAQGQVVWLSLFFIRHTTRERLCVHATVESLIEASSGSCSKLELRVNLRVQESFFHCSKYIRTRIDGLTVPAPIVAFIQQRVAWQELLTENQQSLSETHRYFLSRRVLCFLCTVNREGRSAINHRGGSAGFLVPILSDETAPGGRLLLPDYAGNGAFEAIGNILETKQAALLIPDYVAQVALSISGTASVQEVGRLSAEAARLCRGAERVIMLNVEHIEAQSGDWSALLTYECTHASSLWSTSQCSI